MTNTISTVVLCKDENETLGRTIQSAMKFSDEIIVAIDDTTTDNSKQTAKTILQDFKGKSLVYDYKWENSFCKARNQIIDKATCDWIFTLDAHEYLRPGDEEKLKKVISTIPEEIWFTQLELWDDWTGGFPNTIIKQVHLGRNGKYHYVKDMHNELDPLFDTPGHLGELKDIVIFHQRTAENTRKRREQRWAMAQSIMKPKADAGDITSIFYYMQTCFDEEFPGWNDRYAEGEKYALLLDKISSEHGIPHPNYHTHALYRAAQSALMRHDLDSGIERAFRGLSIRPDQTRLYTMLGHLYREKQQWDKAEHFYLQGLAVQPRSDLKFVGNVAADFQNWLGLSIAFYEQEKYREAFEAAANGCAIKPDMPELKSAYMSSLKKCVNAIQVPHPGKPRVYVVDQLQQFLGGLLDDWAKKYNVYVGQKFDSVMAAWADIIFIEWGDANFTEASHWQTRGKIVCRMHRYELFAPEFRQVKWENVFRMVNTSEHIQAIAKEMGMVAPSLIIHNAVDVHRFPLMSEFKDRRACYVGFINRRKHLDRIIEHLYRNPETADIELYVAGESQADDYMHYITDLVTRLGVADKVFFDGWQKDLNAWLDQRRPRYIISASDSEGLPYSIMEAMSKGCQPAIFNYIGAEKQFPTEAIWTDEDGFVRLLTGGGKHHPKDWRKYIKDNYSLSGEIKAYDDLFEFAIDNAIHLNNIHWTLTKGKRKWVRREKEQAFSGMENIRGYIETKSFKFHDEAFGDLDIQYDVFDKAFDKFLFDVYDVYWNKKNRIEMLVNSNEIVLMRRRWINSSGVDAQFLIAGSKDNFKIYSPQEYWGYKKT